MHQVKVALLALVLMLLSCSSGRQHTLSGAQDDDIATMREALSSSSNSSIATGAQHACVIFAGGKVLCWGDNRYGQLGNGTTAPQFAPVLVSGITTAATLSAGTGHTCAMLSDKTLRCWGRNDFGQLGN